MMANYSSIKEAVPGWPSQISEVQYLSTADQTLQSTLFYQPETSRPVPLLVALHTWSSDYLQSEPAYAAWCIARGWAMVHPNFRGPNSNPRACGSELAVRDILSAVDYARQQTSIDSDRIYLVGVSGGGHASLLMAGHAPTLWAGVSAWCGISDLAKWHDETKSREPLYARYAQEMEGICGGPPDASPAVNAEYRRRSPLSILKAAQNLPIDLNTGIRDGHEGSVPTSQTLEAFNLLAQSKDRISETDIAVITRNAEIPEDMAITEEDPLYARGKVLLRKVSAKVRVTVFNGGHQIIHEAALHWLEQQRKGKPPVWNFPLESPITLQDLSIDAGK